MQPFKIPFLIIFSFCLSSIKICSQDKSLIDSLSFKTLSEDPVIRQQAYRELMFTYMYYDIEIASKYLDSIKMVADISKNQELEAQYLNSIGTYHGMNSHYDSAMVYFHQAIDAFREMDNLERVSALLNNISICQSNMGDFNGALNSSLKSLRLKESLGVTGEDLAASYWSLGNQYGELRKYDESNKWYDLAIPIFEKLQIESDVYALNSLKGKNYVLMDSLDLAESLFLKTSAYYRADFQPNELASSLLDLGQVNLVKKKYRNAEKYLLEAFELSDKNGEARLPGYAARGLSELYLKTNELKKAEKYILLSIQNSSELSLNKKMIGDHEVLSDIYEKQGRYNLSLNAFKFYHQQNDSIFGIEKLKALDELTIQYETEKKQAAIELLEEKNRRNSLEKKGLIAGILSLFILFSSLIYAMRQRLLKNKLAKEKSEQSLAFSEKELALKKQELTAFALQLAHKNSVLEDLRDNVTNIKTETPREVQKIVNKIEFNKNDDNSWEEFRKRFTAVHKDFENQIHAKYANITHNEMRLMSLIKMNLTNKEMANILNISDEGIKKARYRLRKKLSLKTEDSLEAFVIEL